MNPYQNLESGLANLLRPIEDFCTKFFVGTEEGEVLYSDWKMERDPETGRLMTRKPLSLNTVHDGAIHTVQRSPFYNDIILTVGGWNLAIWKEGVMFGPLLQSCCAPKRYTSGHWSLTRPGVFYIGREDGYIDIWDLLEKTHEPAQSQNICITMITCIKPWTFTGMFFLSKHAKSLCFFCVSQENIGITWEASSVLSQGFVFFPPFPSFSLRPPSLSIMRLLSGTFLDTT
uniref:WD repeat domain 63 n=1 Tax=Myotis myotis TaxID=51298 RepID=A0A7J8A3B5_MYOMY|nr:hypothetical protein mMyoMyo1_020513 [Myotis myotis]